jgi:glycosyltransferase involved in cell wall biosynthesis
MIFTGTALALAATAVLLALVPAALFTANLRQYRIAPPLAACPKTVPMVSVIIPARNEEQSLPAALQAVLTNRAAELEIIVVDDHSSDRTAAIVRGFAAADSRVRLIAAPTLPEGWCGKQHACAVGAAAARFERLLFVDADVRLADDALARMCEVLDRSGAGLVSGFPRQVTVTWLERLLLPLMHFLLLGFLPIGRMRASRHPMYGAACGQLILVTRSAYVAAGGHAAIRSSLHDGLKLPRAIRAAGWGTDLFDATDLATCRMYRNAGDVWRGLGKNAREGMAAPAAIVPWSIVLLGGQVLGPALVVTWIVAAIVDRGTWATADGAAALLGVALLIFAAALAYWPRLRAAARFRQSWLGVAFHPLGVCLLMIIQWQALFREWFGGTAEWKGRKYASQQGCLDLPANVNRLTATSDSAPL